MTATTRKVIISIAKTAAAIVAVLLLWWLAAVWANNDLILPEPWEVLKTTFALLGENSTYIALFNTILRAVVAFAISFFGAVLLCATARLFLGAKPFIDGIVAFLRSVPTMSVILLAMITFRSSSVPVFVAVLVALPIIYAAFTRETESDGQLAEVCKVFGVYRSKKLKYVLLPQMKRATLPQIRETLPFCIKIVIAGEAMALPRLGLGRELYAAKVNIETAKVLALTLLALAVCCIITVVCKTAEKAVKK